MNRREALVAVGGVLGAGAAVNAVIPVGAQEDDESGEGEDGGGNETDGEGGGNETQGGNESDDGGNESGGGGGGGTETVNVVDNAFEPDSLSIEPGTTVEWAWQDTQAQHNVVPDSQPEEASWEGHPGLESGDFSFESTFEVEGDYEYICEPHVAQGMTGTITVDPDASEGAADGPIQLVPDAAWTLVIATVAGMISTLSLVYAFMRFGGSNPEQ